MKRWDIPWEPRYFEINDPFAELRYMGAGEYGSVVGRDLPHSVDRVRLASPWEMQRAVTEGNRYTEEVRLGMVTHIANALAHGWVVVVPDSCPEFLVEDHGFLGISVGISTNLIIAPIECLTPYKEDRRREPSRRRR